MHRVVNADVATAHPYRRREERESYTNGDPSRKGTSQRPWLNSLWTDRSRPTRWWRASSEYATPLTTPVSPTAAFGHLMVLPFLMLLGFVRARRPPTDSARGRPKLPSPQLPGAVDEPSSSHSKDCAMPKRLAFSTKSLLSSPITRERLSGPKLSTQRMNS